jgi:HK97 family phage major capsid protein
MSAIEIVRANYSARTDLVGQLREIDEAAEGRAYTEDETGRITDLRSDLEGIDNRIAANLEQGIRAEQMADSMGSMLHLLSDRDSGELTDQRSMGERFVDTDGFRSFAATNGNGNQFPRQTFDDMSFRAVTDVTSGAASGGALVRPALQPRVGNTFLDRRVYLSDLLPHIATTDGSVVYVKDTSPLADLANKAAFTAEGAAKPQAGPTLSIVTEPISTVAAWANITRQVAADAPQVMAYLDGRLRYSLRRVADQAIISGTGVAPILEGLTVRTGTVSYAPGVAEARAISIRHAIALMQAAESVPEIIVLNPADSELFDLTNAATAGLHAVMDYNGPPAKSAWGLTVVVSTAIASGTALLIDPMALAIFDRQQPTAYLTDSHASLFISNILTLLLEERLGLALYDASGVCKVTFNGTA